MLDIIIAGDFAFLPIADSIKEESYHSYFVEVKQIIDKCDFSILNLETPIINGNPTPIKKTGPNLKASKKAFSLIKYLGFKSVTLANNHFFDQGELGVIDTLSGCQENGLEFFGAGYNIEDASQTKYIKVNNTKVAVINCCEREFSIATKKHGGSNPLNPVSQYYAITEAKKNADYVIVIVHGGIEHFKYPTLKMQETYRFFIDAGANAVINHHQHCFSGFERYHGCPIFYGLGNFFFPKPQYSNTFWNYGYLIRLTLDKTVDFEIIPYNQCSGDFSIKILKKEDKGQFEANLGSICEAISDNSELERVNTEFMENSTRSYDWLFQPYNHSLLMKLVDRGLIPKFFSQHKLDEIMALINCQAHYDRFNYYLHKRTSKDV